MARTFIWSLIISALVPANRITFICVNMNDNRWAFAVQENAAPPSPRRRLNDVDGQQSPPALSFDEADEEHNDQSEDESSHSPAPLALPGTVAVRRQHAARAALAAQSNGTGNRTRGNAMLAAVPSQSGRAPAAAARATKPGNSGRGSAAAAHGQQVKRRLGQF